MPLLEQPVPAPLAANVLLNPRLFPVNRAQLWASGSQTIDSILEAPGSVVTGAWSSTVPTAGTSGKWTRSKGHVTQW